MLILWFVELISCLGGDNFLFLLIFYLGSHLIPSIYLSISSSPVRWLVLLQLFVFNFSLPPLLLLLFSSSSCILWILSCHVSISSFFCCLFLTFFFFFCFISSTTKRLMLMARAGYNPDAAEGFWRRWIEKEKENGGGASPPEFFSTHPASQERVEKIREWLPRAREVYRAALQQRKPPSLPPLKKSTSSSKRIAIE